MHMPPVARALQDRDALAGLWISGKNSTGISADKYRRCWPYHLAMKPFYHQPSQTIREFMMLRLLPIWAFWVSGRNRRLLTWLTPAWGIGPNCSKPQNAAAHSK